MRVSFILSCSLTTCCAPIATASLQGEGRTAIAQSMRAPSQRAPVIRLSQINTPYPATLVGKQFTALRYGLNRDRGYKGVVLAEDVDTVRIKIIDVICCVQFMGSRSDPCSAGMDVNTLSVGQELSIPRHCVQ